MVDRIAEINELENSFPIVTVNERKGSYLKNSKEIDKPPEKQEEKASRNKPRVSCSKATPKEFKTVNSGLSKGSVYLP